MSTAVRLAFDIDKQNKGARADTVNAYKTFKVYPEERSRMNNKVGCAQDFLCSETTC